MAAVGSTTIRSFDDVTALDPVDSTTFRATVDAGWSIGGHANGGYLLAILGRAATEVAPHDHPIAASAHYLRSPDPGPVEVSAEVLREGRSATQVRTRMTQHGIDRVEALVTVSRLDPTVPPYWDRGLPAAGTVEFDEAVPLVGPTPSGTDVALLDQVQVRLDPASMGFAVGRPSGRGELHGWLHLPGDAAFDPRSLLFAVDAFPPATFDIEEVPSWMPTLELTVYVRALPAPGPVRILHRAGLIADGRIDESCFVWDCTGQLVAHGTQLAGIRLG